MPLTYDDIPGSWGTMSEAWPSTPHTLGKLLLCTKAHVVPYGSYVVVGGEQISGGRYDYSNAVIRVETEALLKKLEEAYEGMFVLCRRTLFKEEFADEIALIAA